MKFKRKEVFDIDVIVTPPVLTKLKKKGFLNEEDSLGKDSRFRFYLRFKVDELGEHPDPPHPVRFFVNHMQNVEAEEEPSSKSIAKMFLK